jgi:hypothetical protein
MCLILLAWQAHPTIPLVVAANRDEFFARPSAPAAFWPEAPQVLAGRDLEAGGTWLGVSRGQRFAALTNYREGGKPLPHARSRGALVADFLPATTARRRIWHRSRPMLATTTASTSSSATASTSAISNRGDRRPRWLAPGIYGLSNHLLDTPWPKLASAKAAFAAALAGLPAPGSVLYAARRPGNRARFPPAGNRRAARMGAYPLGRFRPFGKLRHARVDAAHQASGRADHLLERSFDADARALGDVCESFQSSLISTTV